MYIWPRLKLSNGLPEFHIGSASIEFVEKWPHLGHIISVTADDKADIMSTRNSSEDETANVNFLYDDIVHVLPSTEPPKLHNTA